MHASYTRSCNYIIGLILYPYTNVVTYTPSDSSCGLQGEDGGSMVLQNIGILPHHYAVSQPRRPELETQFKLIGLVLSGYSEFKWHGKR